MRRIDREIVDFNQIIDIIDKSNVVRLVLNDELYPYIVPLSFGYEAINNKVVLYIHSAQSGKKIDLINKNNNVSVEFDNFIKTETMHYGITARYKSVIANGKALILDNDLDKKKGLQLICNHYGYKTYDLSNCKTFDKCMVIKIELLNITGKKNID
jgi:uncharacterized protein